ncbi:MAG: hypothetical protein IPH85_05185 [Ignavibacteria bacterium]|nr:hypothetical protein [Ignavibacteria bacterium]MBP6509085.1 hypothetical protein [Candidatus Kapabacteria bacterium]MBK6419090.1 hypothetical protein [Ignavibacteria bacterium]MBK6760224.1 hypothetical protein [Ignavibacteria bacterium]MBK7034036.1 hypothetical protein [Ignavibacteria bacterium]
MKRFTTIIPILLLIAGSSTYAQTLVNRGATIHIMEKALVQVNGLTENREGTIRVADSAQVVFNGDVRIFFGGIYMLKDCLVTVTQNLTIGLDGVCWRYDPGVMNVYGTIYNDGDLNNDGEINIGQP